MLSRGALQTELWTSWASLLRSYAAAHGLNAPQHAVVEVGREVITLRVGGRWLCFTHDTVEGTDLPPQPFHLHEDGTVTLAGSPAEEMDLAGATPNVAFSNPCRCADTRAPAIDASW